MFKEQPVNDDKSSSKHSLFFLNANALGLHKWRRYIVRIFFAASISNISFAQKSSRVHIRIMASDTKKITPAMVCITNLTTLKVHTPPAGLVAGEATYPDVFFKGIEFRKDKNWTGPVRKMSGAGAVNGQRTYVYGTLPTLPYWPDPVMYQTSGNFTIHLEPGKWRISIQHGNEYVPVSEVITVPLSKKNTKKAFVLKRWINLPERGWYSGDVHAHHPLDKKAYRDYILQLAKAEDVHLVNILQMGDRKHTYFSPRGFGKQFQIKEGNICIASGQEEPRSDYGHIIGLNIKSLARDTSNYNHYDLVFDKIRHKPESLVGYAHFAYGGEGVKEGLALYAPSGAINFVELLQNGQINTHDYYDYLNLGFRLTAATGSDFPWGSTIGDGRTYVYTGTPFSADKWFAGMKAGKTFVSNGPAIFLEADGELPGSQIDRNKGAVVKIMAKGFSNSKIGTIEKIQLHNNDGLLLEIFNPNHLDSLAIGISHELIKSQWVVASVYCENGALAHTSPIYLIVGARPSYDAVKGPLIVQNLLTVLSKATQVENNKMAIDKGIMERIDKARSYYEKLQAEMKASAHQQND